MELAWSDIFMFFCELPVLMQASSDKIEECKCMHLSLKHFGVLIFFP